LGKLTLQRDSGVSWRYQGDSAHHLEWLGSDSGWMTSNPEVITSLGLVPKNAIVLIFRGTVHQLCTNPTFSYCSGDVCFAQTQITIYLKAASCKILSALVGLQEPLPRNELES
jgi:hypothetical protein